MDTVAVADEGLAERLEMIRQSAATLLLRAGGVKRSRLLRFSMPGFDRAVWQDMCEAGWAGLRVPADAGGSELGMLEVCTLAEQFGRTLAPEPLIQSVLCARLLPASALEEFLAGKSIVLPAWQERVNSLDTAIDAGMANGCINGRKVMVPAAAGADAFLVTTREGVALVGRDAPGLSIDSAVTQDGSHMGTLHLRGVTPMEAWQPCIDALAEAMDDATLACCAYLLGVAEVAFEITLEYIKTRVQFGKPIGAFQAVQHRAADMHVQLCLARASVESAAAILDQRTPPGFRAATVSRAKARLSDAAIYVTKEAIQLHGAIGYTDECDVGLFLRKALTLANFHGSAQVHRKRYAAFYPEDRDE